ncbi:hypothetical protein ACC870_37870, partial [Rhizobium ruizarguesonis]
HKARFEQPLGNDGDPDPDEGGEYQIASEEYSPETATIRRSEQQRVRAVISSLPEAIREILVSLLLHASQASPKSRRALASRD